jgi:signal transduction histidine kinase
MTNDKVRHDLKNQLAIILGFSEILLSDTVPGGSRHADLEEIHRAAVAALALLARLFPEDPIPA